MLVGIHQLHYLPWLRYFEKVARSDVFIVLDNVQFTKNGWQNRNRVKAASGATLLTVPVHAQLGQDLHEIRINAAHPWRKKHWRTIEQGYRKAPFFAEYRDALADVYAREWVFLNDLNRYMLEYFLDALGIDTRVAYASELAVPGGATHRLVNLITAVGGSRYYSGAHAIEQYLDTELLAQAGIAVQPQDWRPPTYPQLHGPFLPDLSILDLLLNTGPDALAILTGRT